MRHVILHGHIFKNAGTTFDWSLRKNFGNSFLDHRQDQLMRQDGSAHLQQLLLDSPQLKAISSHHMTRALPEMAQVRFTQIYLLRHPLLRLRSVYDFERKQRGQTPGSKAAKSKSFRDYVEWRMQQTVAHTIRNTRRFTWPDIMAWLITTPCRANTFHRRWRLLAESKWFAW